MRLLDANVVIYPNGREHTYRRPCQIIMEQTEIQSGEYAIDAEALQEILYFYSRRGEQDKGIGIVERLLSRLPNIIPIATGEITTAMRLLTETPGLSARDAIHAAVVFEHGLEGIVSADRVFERIAGIRRYDPIDVAPG